MMRSFVFVTKNVVRDFLGVDIEQEQNDFFGEGFF